MKNNPMFLLGCTAMLLTFAPRTVAEDRNKYENAREKRWQQTTQQARGRASTRAERETRERITYILAGSIVFAGAAVSGGLYFGLRSRRPGSERPQAPSQPSAQRP